VQRRSRPNSAVCKSGVYATNSDRKSPVAHMWRRTHFHWQPLEPERSWMYCSRFRPFLHWWGSGHFLVNSSPCDLYRSDGLPRKAERKTRLNKRVTQAVPPPCSSGKASTVLQWTYDWSYFVSFVNHSLASVIAPRGDVPPFADRGPHATAAARECTDPASGSCGRSPDSPRLQTR
jgi:hypothetical protein